MKHIVFLFFFAIFCVSSNAQSTIENAKQQAIASYLEQMEKMKALYGSAIDSTTIAKGLEEIEKAFGGSSTNSLQSLPELTSSDMSSSVDLKKNQVLLSDGTLYTVGCGPNKSNDAVGSISFPLNGEFPKSTLMFRHNLSKLKPILLEVAAKFREWEKTARDNNVKEVTKELPIKLPKCSAIWYGNSFYCSKPQEQALTFIYSNGVASLSIVGVYKDGMNQYIKNRATYTWYSADDIEAIANIIDLDNLKDCMQESQDIKDLFQ